MNRTPTIDQMESDGWKFVYAESAYSVCVYAPDGTHIETTDIVRGYAPSCAQRSQWLEEATAYAADPH